MAGKVAQHLSRCQAAQYFPQFVRVRYVLFLSPVINCGENVCHFPAGSNGMSIFSFFTVSRKFRELFGHEKYSGLLREACMAPVAVLFHSAANIKFKIISGGMRQAKVRLCLVQLANNGPRGFLPSRLKKH